MRHCREWSELGSTRHVVGVCFASIAGILLFGWGIGSIIGILRPVIPPLTIWFQHHWVIPAIVSAYSSLLAWAMLRNNAGRDCLPSQTPRELASLKHSYYDAYGHPISRESYEWNLNRRTP